MASILAPQTGSQGEGCILIPLTIAAIEIFASRAGVIKVSTRTHYFQIKDNKSTCLQGVLNTYNYNSK